MADISDIADALAALAAQTLYPNGIGAASLVGVPVRIYQGWPNPQQLDSDLPQGVVHVSIYTRTEERNVTRYLAEWRQLAISPATITLAITGQTITVGGTAPGAGSQQNCAIQINGQPFTYAAHTGDTLTSIATALATLIAASVPGATNTGPVITIPAPAQIDYARVGGQGTFYRELKRQEKVLQITTWAATPAMRTQVAAALDVAFADTPFIALPDGLGARLIYKGSPITDEKQRMQVYRRDLLYSAEFATTKVTTATQIVAEQVGLSPQDSAARPVSTIKVNF